jgi:RNA polymerase sigma factor (sigma-70 family)
VVLRRRGGAVLRQVEALFNVGTIGDLSDGQLLERFATDPDEAAELAFSALVERHGPLVWRVCLAILRDEHEAEDAFQATFLVLVRKARSLWVRDSLGHWLHQVACRTACCLRARVLRRRKLDRRHSDRAPTGSIDAQIPPDADRDAAIHEELNRLPAKYRLPVVLCDLEGHTHQQAARSLGWPIGTVKSRQARGRSLLRDRLTRRGMGLAIAGALIESLSHPAVAEITQAIARRTVNAAMRQAGRLLAGAAVSTSVLTLTQGVLRAMLWIKIRWLAIATLAIGISSGGAIVAMRGPLRPEGTNGEPVANRTGAAAQPEPSKPVPPENVPLRLTLDEAVKAAQAIEDPSARRLALIRIATAQAALDDLASARATARLARQSADRITSEMNRHFGLHRVAKLQAKLGDVESARQIFDQLIREANAKAPWDRMSLLGAVAMEQNESGLRADAHETLKKAIDDADKIVAENSKGDIYFNIVFAQCQIGDFDGVLRIVESLQGKLANDRQTYLQYLARDCDKAGAAEARKILAKALELSKAIPYVYPRGGTQKLIAQALARNGDIPGALAASKMIGQLEEAPAKGGLFAFLNGRQQRERELRRRDDEELARGLRHEVADVLAVVAVEQAKAGDRAAAKQNFREAMDLTLAESDGVMKTQRLRGLVEHLAAAGELKAAEVAIEALKGDEANKAHALVALAKARAKAGDNAGARADLIAAFEVAKETKALPNVINDNVADRKDQAFRDIESAQVALGSFADALVTATVHGHKGLKGEIQAAYAGSQARQGDVAAALKTAESIEDAGFKGEAFRNIALAQSRTGRRDVAHDWAANLGAPQERALALLGVVEGVLERRRERK